MISVMRCGARILAMSLATLGGVCTLASPALAQERDAAAAQALFDQAVELTKQSKYDEACPKFQESNRLDPSIGALFQIANCHEQKGRVASAWALFLDVASQSRARAQLEREQVARERASKLEPRLPRLLVTVPEGSKTAGLEIRRNGILVGSAQWGTPMPVDPGEVELSISAPGKATLRQTVRLDESKTFSYSVPALAEAEAPAPVAAAKQPSPAPLRAEPAAAPARQTSSSATTSSARPWAIGLGAVGVVGLGLSATFAILAKNQYDDSKAECDRDDVNACSPHGIELRNSALTRGNVATVSFIAGGAALAGAGLVWLLSGSSTSKQSGAAAHFRAAPVWTPGSAALFVQGAY
jgi:serine/threonine-protein kinase